MNTQQLIRQALTNSKQSNHTGDSMTAVASLGSLEALLAKPSGSAFSVHQTSENRNLFSFFLSRKRRR